MADATNKIALVTGAGTGVGRAASLALMNAGYTVVLAGRRMEMLEETKMLGDNIGKSMCVSADMTKPESIAALFAKVKDHLVRIDDDITCKACGKRFEIPSHRALVFLEELEGLPQDDEEELE